MDWTGLTERKTHTKIKKMKMKIKKNDIIQNDP